MSADPAAGPAAGSSLADAAAPSSSPVLDIRDLSVVYRTPAGDVRAVDHVNLALGAGEVVGLAGESGSGKSTLAYGACRLLRAPCPRHERQRHLPRPPGVQACRHTENAAG